MAFSIHRIAVHLNRLVIQTVPHTVGLIFPVQISMALLMVLATGPMSDNLISSILI